jgi:hypothetical protein
MIRDHQDATHAFFSGFSDLDLCPVTETNQTGSGSVPDALQRKNEYGYATTLRRVEPHRRTKSADDILASINRFAQKTMNARKT